MDSTLREILAEKLRLSYLMSVHTHVIRRWTYVDEYEKEVWRNVAEVAGMFIGTNLSEMLKKALGVEAPNA
jgi:hypothetical protein